MKRFEIPVMLLILLIISSCSSVRINSFKDSDFKLSDYNTFGFFETDVAGLKKGLNSSDASKAEFDRQIGWINDAIQKEMKKNGLEMSNENPDLKINIGIFLEEVVTTRETRFPQDAPVYIGQRNYSWKSEEIEVDRYTEGTILIDFVDIKAGDLVWMGYITGEAIKDEEKAKQKLAGAMEKLFKD